MSKTKKPYNDKYNGRDDDENVKHTRHESHKEHRQNLRKERALKTNNVADYMALEDEGDDADENPFFVGTQEEDDDYSDGSYIERDLRDVS